MSECVFVCVFVCVCVLGRTSNSKSLQQISQSMPTRASVANKCLVAKTTHACDNKFLFLAPKLWNYLPNSVISITDFKTFRSVVTKHIFV